MGHITGIGGIFFKARDPIALRQWYTQHLGLAFEEWGGCVFEPEAGGSTTWSFFEANTRYFEPSKSSFMFNFRVKGIQELLSKLRAAGVHVEDKVEQSELGTYAWILDLEGNKVELWEPAE